MSIFLWFSRRVGALSMIALLTLCCWVICKEAAVEPLGDDFVSQRPFLDEEQTGAGLWTSGLAYYSLLIHILVLAFPVRACWSIWTMTRSLRKAVQSRAIQELKLAGRRRRVSLMSVSSQDTLTTGTLTLDSKPSCTSSASESSDSERDNRTEDTYFLEDPVLHAIIIPNYQEEVETLEETLGVLASHSQAQTTYDVLLGMEQREADAESKALQLIQKFVRKFRSLDFSIHPADIPGEAAGKGSNLAWAAKKLSAKYSMSGRHNVIVTGIDADSHLSSSYFTNITSMHNACPNTSSITFYAAPIIFDRNAHMIPAVVRVADILWCAAGISGLYQDSSIAPPTSVYSLPLTLIDRVGGWDSGAEAIGEDLHMYIKCFFALNGNLISRTVISPVSQSNVSGGIGGGLRGLAADIRARHRQAVRHMWGALDTGYALRKTLEMWKDRKRTTRAFRPLHHQKPGSSLCITDVDLTGEADAPDGGIFSDLTQETLEEIHWGRVLYLFHRLFEAHFLSVHMTILVMASAALAFLTADNGDRHGIAWTFTVSNILRAMGFMGVTCCLFLYEGFHDMCVATRERAMTKANLADDMTFSRRSFRRNFIDYLIFPIVAPLFGAIPCAQAEICHLWTVDLVYTVSKKAIKEKTSYSTSEKPV